jgi:hypothetical protein
MPTLKNLFNLSLLLISLCAPATLAAQQNPFGPRFPDLDSEATGRWWATENPRLLVARDKVVAFALYTHDRGVLKLTAQLYPLKPDESRSVRLEFKRGDQWTEIATQPVNELGWSSHFRIEKWDNTKDVHYRVRHGENATFEGLIRKDPIEKPVIVVGSLSCNSSRTPGTRSQIVENLKTIDPDFLFFAGDQSYHHTQHTFGWLEFGEQFKEVLKDRPVVTIPDDHDVGQANIWGENGKKASTAAGPDGGYFYPVKYVNMVQRCQTWHLPDPYDPRPIRRGIAVYYSHLRVGGIDFAILEDRKFKSGPKGKIPQMGPRPDHIDDPNYDRQSIDLPDLKLLGDRQLKFLDNWSQDWTGAQMKCVLSQTAFCGAVHLHGTPDNRLLADLDCNGWPQSGRIKALQAIRRAWGCHLCGDQHLAVLVKHGIEEFSDGPFAFTSPAIVNTIYGRWWHPVDEKAGPNPVAGSPLQWTGDFEDGLGNKISMLAYANPKNRQSEKERGDGFGIIRFDKEHSQIKFECWPRFADVNDGDSAQFPGWPVTVQANKNDGRISKGTLNLEISGIDRPVVQVLNELSGDILYTVRFPGNKIQLPVYAENATYTVKIGRDKPDAHQLRNLSPHAKDEFIKLTIQ